MIKKEFNNLLNKINNFFIKNEDVHYCQLCGEKFVGKDSYDQSEDCTYSHEYDNEDDMMKYPNYLLKEKTIALEEKEKIITSAKLYENKNLNKVIKKRL